MYKVICFYGGRNYALHDPESNDLRVFDDELETEDSHPGSFRFSVSFDHPYIDKIVGLSSDIRVYDGDEEIFRGRPVSDSEDLYRTRTFLCEGELAFLYDSIQPRRELHDITPAAFFTLLIEEHNRQVTDHGPIDKTFHVGNVTVADDENTTLFRYTNRETTLDDIQDKIIDRLGGHLRVRLENGVRYLDLIAENDLPESDQTISLGENLLDYAKETDYTEIATACIPLGAPLEETEIAALDAYLTIAEVNDGSEILRLDKAIEKYGLILKTLELGDYTVPANLKAAGEKWLTDGQYETMTLELTAVDMHGLGYDIRPIRKNTKVRVFSEPHGMDRYFTVAKRVYHLTQPELDTVTFGVTERKKSYTSSANRTIKVVQEHIEKLIDEQDDNLNEDLDSIRDDVGNITNIFNDTTILNAITTEALYASRGDFADLRVDRLSTSRRIAKYLSGDASDDNYIKIQEEQLQFIAGICTNPNGRVQADDPDGLPLFWKTNPDPDGDGVIQTGVNGYPVVTDESGDSVQVYTTTERTDWPVYVYPYIEQVKRSIAFELESAGDNENLPIYSVVDTFGAGNQTGTNQLKIRKSTNGAEILYTPNTGTDIGVKMNNDGTMELIGYESINGENLTDALYAPSGEIADLAVNRLSTSRRIIKYLNQDRSDDNYIHIQEQELAFISGECTGNREQAKSPAGDLLYWSRSISGLSRDASGYPVTTSGERVFTSTTPTDWPVYIYKYQETVKRRIKFELNSSNNIYEPVDIYGAGNAQGYNYAKIAKTTNGFDVLYINPAGKELGVKMGSDGYMDLIGSRKTSQLNFSNWNNGSFTEKRDGLSNTLSYQVQFDSNQRPVKITDPSGHETVITW